MYAIPLPIHTALGSVAKSVLQYIHPEMWKRKFATKFSSVNATNKEQKPFKICNIDNTPRMANQETDGGVNL